MKRSSLHKKPVKLVTSIYKDSGVLLVCVEIWLAQEFGTLKKQKF
jgi:hypothetical protein